SGKGAIACTDPLSAGVFGRYDRIANGLIASSDCLIVVGCKLGEVVTKRFTVIPPTTPLIHIDIQAEEIGRTSKADIALVGDARLALEDIATALGDGSKRLAARADYLAEIPVKMAQWSEPAKDRTTSKETP